MKAIKDLYCFQNHIRCFKAYEKWFSRVLYLTVVEPFCWDVFVLFYSVAILCATCFLCSVPRVHIKIRWSFFWEVGMSVKTSGKSVLNIIHFLGSLISQSQRLKQSSSPEGHHLDTGMKKHNEFIEAELLVS